MKRAIIATLTFAAAMLSTVAHGQDDHGNVFADATSVAFPSQTSGRIDPASDDDFFTFTLTARTQVVIDDAGSVDTAG